MRGGTQTPGPGKTLGRNPIPESEKMVKKQFLIRQDQIELIKSLGRYKGSAWVRDAIDEKLDRDAGKSRQ